MFASEFIHIEEMLSSNCLSKRFAILGRLETCSANDAAETSQIFYVNLLSCLSRHPEISRCCFDCKQQLQSDLSYKTDLNACLLCRRIFHPNWKFYLHRSFDFR